MVTRLGRVISASGAPPASLVYRSTVVSPSAGQQRVDFVASFHISSHQRSTFISKGQRLEKISPARPVLASAWRWNDEEIGEEALSVSFHEGVKLFNAGEYYQCHDVLESLWNDAPEPQRSILHGILQCAVGLYHLLHQNHRGAMVELGEGLAKLRRVGFGSGPLHDFEREASAVLDFIYNTQLEHAACSDDICITMDGSEKSYLLLGNFGAGEILYKIAQEENGLHIHFISQRSALSPVKVKLPILQASEEDLYM